MTVNKQPSSHKDSACSHISAASNLIEKSMVSILEIIQNIEKTVAQLPDNEHKKQILKLISSFYEVCTFEDLASQHLTKVLEIIDGSKIAQNVAVKDNLLRGPALNGEQAMSQNDIDKLLNQ